MDTSALLGKLYQARFDDLKSIAQDNGLRNLDLLKAFGQGSFDTSSSRIGISHPQDSEASRTAI